MCDEVIPIRLLGKHAELEAERLEEIVRCIGSTEVLGEAEPEDRCVDALISKFCRLEANANAFPFLPIHIHIHIPTDDSSSARTRKSAVKARQSLKPGSSSTSSGVMLGETMKTLRTLKKRRKERHAKLREITKEDDEDGWWGHGADGGQVCPVCAKFVKGGMNVMEAHVDLCLTNVEEEERSRGWGDGESGSADVRMGEDVEVEVDNEHYGVLEGVNFRGACFTRAFENMIGASFLAQLLDSTSVIATIRMWTTIST